MTLLFKKVLAVVIAYILSTYYFVLPIASSLFAPSWPNSGQSFARSCFHCRSFFTFYPVVVMPRVPAHSDSEESVKGRSVPPAELNRGGDAEEVEDEENDEDVSEYEIEEVLDAKRGVFPDVRALFVSKFLDRKSVV